jgi:hypothetical protein
MGPPECEAAWADLAGRVNGLITKMGGLQGVAGVTRATQLFTWDVLSPNDTILVSNFENRAT